MAISERDSFADLERHRVALEKNVAKLRAALQHWQAWEIEYEGLKEDILQHEDSSNHAGLVSSLEKCNRSISEFRR